MVVHTLIDLALLGAIGLGAYALAVLMVAITGPHNGLEKRERRERGE